MIVAIEFGSQLPAGKKSRTFTMKVEYKPKAGGPVPMNSPLTINRGGKECPIELFRPPVVLVHGTYDEPTSCWNTAKKPLATRAAANG